MSVIVPKCEWRVPRKLLCLQPPPARSAVDCLSAGNGCFLVVFSTKGSDQVVVRASCATNQKGPFGEPGHRSPYLSHAKRALYHLS
jgi:hypothetical protein